jgi:hypothetical protein
MAYLSKLNYKESRNSDGSIFSKGAECEIMFGPDEVTFDLEKGFERDGIVLLARAFVAKGLQEKGTVTAKIDVELNKEAPAQTETPKGKGPDLNAYKHPDDKPATSPASSGSKAPAPASSPKIGKDQVDIILDVMKRSEKNRKIVDEYLGSVKAASIEDLARAQGTALLDRLYKGGVL